MQPRRDRIVHWPSRDTPECIHRSPSSREIDSVLSCIIIISEGLSRILGAKAQKSPFVPFSKGGFGTQPIYREGIPLVGLTSCGSPATPAQTEVCGHQNRDTERRFVKQAPPCLTYKTPLSSPCIPQQSVGHPPASPAQTEVCGYQNRDTERRFVKQAPPCLSYETPLSSPCIPQQAVGHPPR